MVWTVTEVAQMLNTTSGNILRYVKDIGIRRRGGIYLLTQKDIDYIKSRQGQVGRPSL